MDTGIKTGVVMVIVFAIGLLLGYYAGSNNLTASDAMTQIEEATTGDTMNAGNNADGGNTGDSQVSGNGANESTQQPSGATTVNASQLTPGQRKLLETLGVDTDSITITPEMIACAEAKVGASRVAEIQNGATPTFMEGASLMACYSS